MIKWQSFAALDGRPLTELPGLSVKSSLSSIIGRGDSVTVSLPVCDRWPANWRDGTQPMRAVLAAINDGLVLWSGWVEKRTYGSGEAMELTLQPAEEWLKRNYIPELTFSDQRYTTIARGIGLDRLAAQFNGRLDEDPTLDWGDRTYRADQDMTCLAGLQNLMKTKHGAEFATSWELLANGHLGIVVHTAYRLGGVGKDTAGAAVLSQGSWQQVEDCSDGKGATIWRVVSNRSGDERKEFATSNGQVLQYGWLELERRWTPDTGSVDDAVLQQYMYAAKESQQYGLTSISVETTLDHFMPGRDFVLGDYVDIDMTNLSNPELQFKGKARVIGWVCDPDPVSGEITKIKPMLSLED